MWARKQKVMPAVDLLHLWEISDRQVVTTEGCHFVGLELLGLDSEHLPANVLSETAVALYDGMKADLPEETLLQFVLEGHSDYADVFEGFERAPEPEDPVLRVQRRARLSYLQGLNLRRFRTRLYVGRRRGLSKKAFSKLSLRDHQRRGDEVERIGGVAESVLSRAGVRTRRLEAEELFEAFYRALNPGRSVPPLRTDGLLSIREELFDAPLGASPRAFEVGGRFTKVLSLRHLPEATRFTLMEAFLHLPFDFRLVVNVFVPKQDAAQGAFRALRRITHADAHKGAHVTDEERMGRLREANAIAELLAETRQRLVHIGMQLVVDGASMAELEERARQASEHLKAYGFRFVEETGRHDLEVMKSLPAMAVTFDRYRLVTSHNAVDALPVFGGCHGDRDPVFLVRTARGELFSYNPVERGRDNWNATVFGASGSGKSVFMNMLITTAMLSNKSRGRVVVVDFAGEAKSSYRMVAKLFGGTFVPVLSGDRSLGMNPFPPAAEVFLSDGSFDGRVLSFLTVITDLVLSSEGRDRDAQLFRQILQRAILDLYERFRGTGRAPTYRELHEEISQLHLDPAIDQARRSILQKLLEGFLQHPDSALFMATGQGDARGDFVIFDLFGIERLEPHFQSAITFLVCERVRRLAFDGGDGIKYVVLDEVAQLLRRPEMAALVHELYSTARKHRTSIWTVTQRYADYVKSAVAGTINLNSTTQVLLSHARSAEAKRLVAEDLDLSPRERYLFETLTTKKGVFSEALLRTEVFAEARGEKQTIFQKLRIELSPFDYELSTSDPEDRARQARALRRHPELPLLTVLEKLAKRRAEGQR